MREGIKSTKSIFYWISILALITQYCKPKNNNENEINKNLIVSASKNTGTENTIKLKEEKNNNNNQINNNPNNELENQIVFKENNFSKNITLEEIINKIKSEKIKNIVIMTGAGISVNAGIPDFRSKNGFYKLVKKYQKDNDINIYTKAEDFYTVPLFKKYPEHFFKVLKECGKFHEAKPTITHYLFTLLNDKGKLLKYYTQNIDFLEDKAGLPIEKIVRAHGSFKTATCMDCKKQCNEEKMIPFFKKGEVAKCNKIFDTKCKGIMKPDVVFFNDPITPLGFNYEEAKNGDFQKTDLVIIIGTSLKVQPFCLLPDTIKENVPRILINMEKVGNFNRKNDLFIKGDCDKAIVEIIRLLGWEKKLLEKLQKDNNISGIYEKRETKYKYHYTKRCFSWEL